MNKKVLLLGGVLPVLGLLRRIQSNCLKVDVISSASDVVVSSRFGDKTTYSNSSAIDGVINNWIERQAGEKEDWLVIPCSETFLEYMGAFKKAGYQVFSCEEDALSIFSDKRKLYPWLSSIGVYTGEFYSLSDSLKFFDGSRYIVKAAKSLPEFEGRFKTAVVSTDIEFKRAVERIPRRYKDGFIVQPIYRESESLSYGGVWISGEEVAGVVVRQVRQYPQGVTSAAEIHKDDADVGLIKSVVNKIASQKTLHGFFELEFIKSEMGLIPIDLNPRLWGWSSFLFLNYPGLAKTIVDQKVSILDRRLVNSWSNLWRDVPAILNKGAGFSGKARALSSLYKYDYVEFVCWQDIRPEFRFFLKRVL